MTIIPVISISQKEQTKKGFTQKWFCFNCQTLTSIAEIIYAETKHKDQSVKKASLNVVIKYAPISNWLSFHNSTHDK